MNYSIPKKYLDEFLKNTDKMRCNEPVEVPVGMVRDLIKEVRQLRRMVSKPKKMMTNGTSL